LEFKPLHCLFPKQIYKRLIMISDLLFYESLGGIGEFYTTYLGGINLLQHYPDWRRSWTQIIPGNFGGIGFTDLLFYEASTGTGEFYKTDGLGGISLMKQYTDWRGSWTKIIPGNFAGNGLTDLLFYDASAGTGEFYALVGPGEIQLLKQHTDWRGSWNKIVPGHFGNNDFTDLLFYEAATGTGEFYTTDGSGEIEFLLGHNDWRGSWTEIIPGNFGGNGQTDLLFYEAATGTGEFYTTDQGEINLISQQTNWRSSWKQIVPGLFAPLQAVRLHLKLLKEPKTSVDVQIAQIREVFVTAGIRVIIRSTEFLNLPDLLDVDIGDCKGHIFGDNITGDMRALYNHRKNVGENEIAIYFLHSAMGGIGGCAKFPEDKAGAVITDNIIPWTLAHEVGHILGLSHTDNKDLLMYGGADPYTHPPPDLLAFEKQVMAISKYTIKL
jgi:hypothetical protein